MLPRFKICYKNHPYGCFHWLTSACTSQETVGIASFTVNDDEREAGLFVDHEIPFAIAHLFKMWPLCLEIRVVQH